MMPSPRIISAFPPHQQGQARLQLAGLLKAVISQRLVPRSDGRGRVPALEVMIVTGLIREMIMDANRTHEIPEAISKGHVSYGMQTFDQSLFHLFKTGKIDLEEALRKADSRDGLALKIRMSEGGGENHDPYYDPNAY